jgi:DNA primase
MEAVEILAGEVGLEVPKPSQDAAEAERRRHDLHSILETAASLFQQSLYAPEGAAALAYLRRRGLSEETIRRFGLGYAGEGRGALARRLATDGITPAQLMECGLLRPGEDGAPRGELFFNRVMFPIRDRRGRAISFGGRILGDGQPKYVNGPETPVFSKRRTLYALDFAREAARGGAPAVVVEGYMDVIALHQAGFGAALAPLGTALTEEQLEVLWQLSPAPTLCFDGDAAGARAAARAAELALPHLTPERTIRIATLPAGDDPDTLVRKSGPEAFTAVLNAARPLADALFDLLREAGGAATPEQRAGFRARLVAATARIGDKGLASEYRRHMLDRFFAATRKGVPAAARTRAPRPVPGADGANAERLRTLAAILLRHPGLLPRFEEAYAALPLPPPARRLLQGLQNYADSTENLDFDGLIAHLTTLRLADDIAWALGNANLPLPPYAGADATASEAEAGWWQIYGLMRRGSLEADVAAARREFAASPTPLAQTRLMALSAALSIARCGGLAADEETED